MDAVKRNINEIFISCRILEVPFFQRVCSAGNSKTKRALSPFFAE